MITRHLLLGLALIPITIPVLAHATEQKDHIPTISYSSLIAADSDRGLYNNRGASSDTSDPMRKILPWLLFLLCGGGGAARGGGGTAKGNDK